jgi:hypothetical protein
MATSSVPLAKNGYPYGKVETTDLDERDAAIYSERFHALQDVHGPRVGDFVRFADGRMERISHDWDGDVQTSEGGSFYLGKGYVSFSGGLNPSIPTSELVYKAEHKRGSCWFFHHDHYCADNGVAVDMDFRVYEVDGVREHVYGLGRDWWSDYVAGTDVAPIRNLDA